MAAEQGKETRTGQWPTLNVERVYSTTVPADELARAPCAYVLTITVSPS